MIDRGLFSPRGCSFFQGLHGAGYRLLFRLLTRVPSLAFFTRVAGVAGTSHGFGVVASMVQFVPGVLEVVVSVLSYCVEGYVLLVPVGHMHCVWGCDLLGLRSARSSLLALCIPANLLTSKIRRLAAGAPLVFWGAAYVNSLAYEISLMPLP